MKNTTFIFFFTLLTCVSFAQVPGVGINTTGTILDDKNFLEVLAPNTLNEDLSAAIYAIHPGAVAGTGYGILISKTGASTTNIAGDFTASGATNNTAGNFTVSGAGTLNKAAVFTAAGATTNTAATFTTSGAHTTNTAASFAASGAASNYAIIVPANSGNVGIGTSTPTASVLVHVVSTNTTADSKAIHVQHTAAVGGNGYGIYSEKTGASTGSNYGGYFSASGGVTGNGGVVGVSTGASSTNFGVVGQASGGTTYNIAVSGSATGASAANYGGRFGASGATANYAIIVPASSGNVGIGTESPSSKAILDISSTTQGVLLPRMTTTERNAIASPPVGLMIVNTTTSCFEYYSGTAWLSSCAGFSNTGGTACTVVAGTASASVTTGASGYATSLTLTGATATGYQWQTYANGNSYSDISGATSAVYNTTVNSATSASASQYFRCKVTDGTCVAYSNVLTLTNTCASNSWVQKPSLPSGTGRLNAVAFTIGTKGYVGTGYNSSSGLLKDFWEFDPSTNAWTQSANYGGTACYGAIGFATATKGYLGTGLTTYADFTTVSNQLWEYDPSTNAWTQKTNVTAARGFAAGVCDGTNGFIIGGIDNTGTPTNTNYRFNVASNNYTTRAAISMARYNHVAFNIGTTLCMGSGANGAWSSWGTNSLSSFQRTTDATNNWGASAMTSIPSGGAPEQRQMAFAFSTASYGYVGGGGVGGSANGGYINVYRYDLAGNSWTAMTSFTGGYRAGAVAFTVSNVGYVGFGIETESDGDWLTTYKSDLYQYFP